MAHLATNASRARTEDTIVRYLINPKASKFTVRAFATGLLSAFGHSPTIAIRDFEGDVQFTQAAGKLEDVRLDLKIQTGSLEVTDDISEKDRREMHREMREKVLEVDHYPEIVFACSAVTANGNGNRYWVSMDGELTLHGVTHKQVVPARVVIDGENLRASGEFPVRQSDYGIAPVTAVAGGIKLKDELKCAVDIVAAKQG